MKIKYKLIEHERFEDAPFIGALISSIECNYNCKNCFNQHLHKTPTVIKDGSEIIAEIKANIFNKGIIFGGLEWSNQLEECIWLAKEANKNGLLTMLYTGNELLNSLTFKYFDYVKQGRYVEKLKTINCVQYGVSLASTNQRIYKRGTDY